MKTAPLPQNVFALCWHWEVPLHAQVVWSEMLEGVRANVTVFTMGGEKSFQECDGVELCILLLHPK